MPELKVKDLEKVSGGILTHSDVHSDDQEKKDLPISKSTKSYEKKNKGEVDTNRLLKPNVIIKETL